MIKAVLFDIDGVVIGPRNEFFSEKYAREQGVPIEKLIPFFKGPFKQCAVGKADIKEELEKVKEEWSWKGTVEELLGYWFESEKNLNDGLMKEVEALRERGVVCMLASDNEKERAGYLFQEQNLEETFDADFFSCDLGYTKEDPEFWQIVKERLLEMEFSIEEVIYWDDDEKNVEAAREAGIKAELFRNIESYKEKMTPLLEGSAKSPEVE